MKWTLTNKRDIKYIYQTQTSDFNIEKAHT